MDKLIIITVIFFSLRTVAAQSLPVDCPFRSGNPEEAKAAAGEWFSKGIVFAALENFASAEQAFRCSLRLVEHPATLLNIAKAANQGGEPESATNTYREFLDKYPNDDKAPFVIEELKKIEATFAAASTKVGNDEKPNHTLTVTDEEVVSEVFAPVSSNADEYPDNAQADEADNPPIANSTHLPAGYSKRIQRIKIAGWTTLSLGAGALAASIATGSVALSYSNYLDNNCDGSDCSAPYFDKVDSTNNLATSTDVLIGAGAAAIVVGAALVFVSKRKQKETRTSVSVSPQVAPGYTSFGINGVF